LGLLSQDESAEETYRIETIQNNTALEIGMDNGLHDQSSSTKTLPAKITKRATTHVEKKTITKACSQLAVAGTVAKNRT